MNTTKIFPCIIMSLSICAAIVYFVKGDVRHGLYWSFAAGITASVTF